MAQILIIDDDQTVGDMLSRTIINMGHEVTCEKTGETGLLTAKSRLFDVVFLDVRLPGESGLDILPQINKLPSRPVVFIMTAYGDPDGAELAIQNGAWDYLTKPVSLDQFKLYLTRALEYRGAKKALSTRMFLKRDGIIGHSGALAKTLEQIMHVCEGDANVLIQGETGTGKELIARAIHENSPRGLRRFVIVDCAALPETIVESLLFGHERGAFTSADQKSEGLIRQADGGTLFLDEIGEIPISIQKSFLRVLQEKQFLPVGANKYIQSDFRLVAATNRDLEDMVARKEFREDLLFRLRGYTIDVPPLRDRLEDIEPLLNFYMHKLCKLTGMRFKHFTQEFLKTLSVYSWPGNVRELYSALEHSVSSAKMEANLLPIHLPTNIRAQASRDRIEKKLSNEMGIEIDDRVDHDASFPTFRAFRYDMERVYLLKLIRHCEGNRTQACNISGLSRTRLFELLKKHYLSDR